MRRRLMSRSVGEDRLYLIDGQSEILGYVGFVDTGFPVLNDVVSRHTRAPQYGPTVLYAGLYFDERAFGPIHWIFSTALLQF